MIKKNMKKQIIAFAVTSAAIMLLGSCSNEENVTESNVQTITASADFNNSTTSRTTYTETGEGTAKGLSVAWEETADESFKTCCPTSGSTNFDGFDNYVFTRKSGSGKKCTFETQAQKPAVGDTWYAIFPNNDYVTWSMNSKKPSVKIELTNQSGLLSDLKYLDLMYAYCVVTEENITSPSFSFEHKIPFLKLNMTFPSKIEASLGQCKITLITGTNKTATKYSILLKSGTVYSTTTSYGPINVENVDLTGLSSKTLYLALPTPVALSPYGVTINITDANGVVKYTGALAAKALQPGYLYTANVNMTAVTE